MTDYVARLWVGAVIGTVGMLLVYWSDWRIALGVALAIWGNNIQIQRRGTER